MFRKRTIAVVGAVGLLLAACGPAATATPVPTATRTPAATAAPTTGPTATPAVLAPASPTPKPQGTPATAVVKPKYGGVLRVWLRGEPVSWGPIFTKASQGPTRMQHNIVFSNLFVSPNSPETKCNYSVRVPSLAEKWSWVNDTTFEVKIRAGAYFHAQPPVNGREVTGEDVAFSHRISLMEDPILKADPVKARLDRIEVVDRYTVRYYTKTPLPALIPSGLGSYYGAVILAKEARGADGYWNDPWKSYIGSGPFMFKAHVPGVRVVYEKHPRYFMPGQPYVDRLEYHSIPDLSTGAAALRAGKLDLWDREVPTVMARDLRRTNPDLQIQECSSVSWPGQIFLRDDRPPFNDIRVRRAVAMSIDREALIKTAFMGEGFNYPLYGAIEDVHIKDLAEIPPEIRKYVEYHPDEARRLLAEAGKPGLEFTLQYSTRFVAPLPQVAEFLAASFEAVGMKPKIQPIEYAAYATKIARCDYEMMFTLMAGENPYERLGRHHSKYPCPTNASLGTHPDLDAAIDAFEVEIDPVKAKEAAKKVQLAIIDGVWDLSLPSSKDYSVLQPWVRNFGKGQTYYSGAWAERVWLDR